MYQACANTHNGAAFASRVRHSGMTHSGGPEFATTPIFVDVASPVVCPALFVDEKTVFRQSSHKPCVTSDVSGNSISSSALPHQAQIRFMAHLPFSVMARREQVTCLKARRFVELVAIATEVSRQLNPDAVNISASAAAVILPASRDEITTI